MSHRTTFRLPPPRPQQGIVLIVVLIMLVVIGLVSVNMMRESLSTDQVSNNVRSEALASEAAQIALAYCEAESIKASSTTVTKKAKPTSGNAIWQTLSNWNLASGAANAPTTLTEAQMIESNASFKANKMPQCMAEYSTASNGTDTVLIVTARGFSPDYTADANGNTASGSVVWLQSILRVN